MDAPESIGDATLARAVDASMDGVAVLGADGDFRYVDDAHATMHGVEDDGPGIATDTVGSIFDRCATTNRERAGAAFELTFDRI